jgi:cell division protease FtsH
VRYKKNLRKTAYHEAGHAILMEVLSKVDPPNIVTIIPTGGAKGYAAWLPREDREDSHVTKTYLEQRIMTALGGRAAEALVYKEITTGAYSDIKMATGYARDMVIKFGMSEVIGPIQFGSDNDEVFLGRDFANTRNYGEQTASLIDNEIKRLVEDAYNEALRILTLHMEVMHNIVELLLRKEKISGEEVRACFPYGALDQTPVEDDFEPAF